MKIYLSIFNLTIGAEIFMGMSIVPAKWNIMFENLVLKHPSQNLKIKILMLALARTQEIRAC